MAKEIDISGMLGALGALQQANASVAQRQYAHDQMIRQEKGNTIRTMGTLAGMAAGAYFGSPSMGAWAGAQAGGAIGGALGDEYSRSQGYGARSSTAGNLLTGLGAAYQMRQAPSSGGGEAETLAAQTGLGATLMSMAPTTQPQDARTAGGQLAIDPSQPPPSMVETAPSGRLTPQEDGLTMRDVATDAPGGMPQPAPPGAPVEPERALVSPEQAQTAVDEAQQMEREFQSSTTGRLRNIGEERAAAFQSAYNDALRRGDNTKARSIVEDATALNTALTETKSYLDNFEQATGAAPSESQLRQGLAIARRSPDKAKQYWDNEAWKVAAPELKQRARAVLADPNATASELNNLLVDLSPYQDSGKEATSLWSAVDKKLGGVRGLNQANARAPRPSASERDRDRYSTLLERYNSAKQSGDQERIDAAHRDLFTFAQSTPSLRNTVLTQPKETAPAFADVSVGNEYRALVDLSTNAGMAVSGEKLYEAALGQVPGFERDEVKVMSEQYAKIRNEMLRGEKGTQTEGDLQRITDEMARPTDPMWMRNESWASAAAAKDISGAYKLKLLEESGKVLPPEAQNRMDEVLGRYGMGMDATSTEMLSKIRDIRTHVGRVRSADSAKELPKTRYAKPVRIRTQAQYDALDPGMQYIDSRGKIATKTSR